MKKKLILLGIIFLLTGCSSTYEIEIYNEKVIEKTAVLYSKNEVTKDPYEYTKEISLKYDDNGDFLSYSKKKNIEEKDKIGVELTNEYKSVEEYNNYSNVINYCYYAKNITSYKNDYITLKTSNKFTCFDEIEELEKVTIKIKSNHKLKETNADRINGHTYYWDITKENYRKKPISLVLYSDKYVWNYNNSALKTALLIIFIIGGTVFVTSKVYKIYKEKENL